MNEAFAAQILPCIKDLGLMKQIDEKINPNEGSRSVIRWLFRARISTTLINQMERKDAQFGLTMYRPGKAIATVFERALSERVSQRQRPPEPRRLWRREQV
ncbi:hypothetical protein MJ575_01770 [Klebsiella pneumoniae]|nr:hypothetical protein MJ575_01770 [Klebsiella pneumoniae]